MKSPWARRVVALGFGLALVAGGVAIAQPQPNMPPGHPPMPGSQPGMPPGHMGRPPGMPGMPPPGMPGRGAPPGTPPGHGKRPPIRRPHAPQPAEEEEHEGAGHHAGHCPGQGPEDPPPPTINLWYGLLGVNNERAQSGSVAQHVLFRYENAQNPCDPKNEPAPFLAALFNFAVLAFVIGKFGKKPVAAALLKRKESIMQEIDNATRLREEAESRLEEYEEKFENIEEKLEATKAEFAAQSEQEKERILLEAEERRVRMRLDAEFRIEQELKEARLALLAEAVEGAVKAAEALLKSRVAGADQDRIAEEYLSAVGKAAAGSAHGASATGGRA